MVRVTFTRQAAPSFKGLRIAGKPLPTGRDSRGRGSVPNSRVLIAYDAEGYAWQHERIFTSGEYDKAKLLQDRVEAAGEINPRHWRKTHKEY